MNVSQVLDPLEHQYPFEETSGTLESSTPAPDEFSSSTLPPEDETIVYTEPNMAVVGLLLGLIAALSICFLLMTIPPLYVYVRKRLPDNPKQVERRYETIEAWVISKRIKKHDDTCERIRKLYPPHTDPKLPDLKMATSYDTAETADESMEVWEEEEACECPICMESFEPGEIVSWSPNSRCEHVFHHECIKQWLLKKALCPYCRNTYLPVDEYRRTLDKSEIKELAKQRSYRSATTYYCHQDGLVTIGRKPRCNRNDLQCINNLTSSGVKKGELCKLRGSRLGDLTNSCDDVDAPIIDSPAMDSVPTVDILTGSHSPSGSVPINVESALEDNGNDEPISTVIGERAAAIVDEEMGEPSESPSLREGEEVTNEQYIAAIQAQAQVRSLRW